MYNYILTHSFINKCKEKINKSTILYVKEEYNKNKEKFDKCIDKLDEAIQTLKSNTAFYNMKNLLVSYHIIEQILEFISLAYYPFKINKFNYFKMNERINYDDYKFYTDDNIFVEYFKTKIDEIKEYNASYIGISITSESQVIAALSLAKLIKKAGINAKVILGGANITRRIEHIKKDVVLFENFIDGVMFGAGERATVEYMEFLENKREISSVSNLIYFENGEIKENKISLVTYSDIHFYDYSDYDMNNYYLPEGVLLLSISNSCYYKKCSFCLHNIGTIYKQKLVDDVINEIKEIIKTKKVNKFFITDNAVHPIFLEEFSRKIIEQNIEIYYSCDVRFEKEFDYELLKQLYKSGLRVCYWGLETANNRVLNFIKKGTTIERNKQILENAYKIGIFNFVYFMLGIPTETVEEMNDTVNFMIKNRNIINACQYNSFNMVKGTDIYDNPQKYGLTKNDVEIEKDFDLCPEPLRKVSLEQMENGANKIYSVYNRFYNKIFQYGTNELLLLYKAKNVEMY
jgi:radical SAM superfamily enzyme YgiQ (UPF0313 family)